MRISKIQLAALIYIVAAILITWPLIFNLNGFLLPQRYTDLDHSDAFIFMDGIDFWKNWLTGNMPPMDDTHYEFLLDIPLTYALPGIILSPILGETVYHNLFFLVTLALTGFTMFLYLRYLTIGNIASIIGGLIYLSSNKILHHYMHGHMNHIQFFWIPLVFYFTEKGLIRPNRRYSILLGITIALLAFSSAQYTIYMSLILPIYIGLRLYFARQKINRKLLANSAISLTIALFISSTYIIIRILGKPTQYPIEDNLKPGWSLNSYSQLINPDHGLSLGLITITLFILGTYLIIKKGGAYRKYIAHSILALLAVVLMIGPVSAFHPYYWFNKFWPFVSYVRVPQRFFPFAHFFLIVVALLPIGKRKWLVYSVALLLLLQVILSAYVYPHHIFFI